MAIPVRKTGTSPVFSGIVFLGIDHKGHLPAIKILRNVPLFEIAQQDIYRQLRVANGQRQRFFGENIIR